MRQKEVERRDKSWRQERRMEENMMMLNRTKMG